MRQSTSVEEIFRNHSLLSPKGELQQRPASSLCILHKSGNLDGGVHTTLGRFWLDRDLSNCRQLVEIHHLLRGNHQDLMAGHQCSARQPSLSHRNKDTCLISEGRAVWQWSC